MITDKTFDKLLKPTRGTVVSVYMPTHQASPNQSNQDKIRFKNLLDLAENDLAALGKSRSKLSGQLGVARDLLKDEPFWQHQRQGLALFISSRGVKHYPLPFAPPEKVVTARRYHVKPLLPLRDLNRNFYVLCVSPKKVRLFRADYDNIAELEVENLPDNINEALGQDDNERSIQHFVATTTGRSSNAVFHGHGGAKDLADVDPPRFIRAVADAVGNELGSSQAPLIFAGDDKLFFLYREAARKVNVLKEHLGGNHDDIKPDQLHRNALELIKPRFEEDVKEVTERYLQAKANSPELAGEETARIVESALSGKVQELLLADNRERWGLLGDGFSVETVLPERRPGAVDLLDVAAAATLEHGGRVLIAGKDDMPGRADMVAILRY